ncbi:hypothetical protein [Bacillus weihaiensis]|uniref:hypothetical protein n=1 Tax=Bacillus weihaiensis TaxID=1547283 RepID=UPI002355546A|nr:hypothetical protein [Bacillus weihaiensis]
MEKLINRYNELLLKGNGITKEMELIANILIEEGYCRTKDTGRFLQDGEEAFYIEGAEWYDSKLRLLIDCFKSGMTKQEIEELLFCHDTNEDGIIYWTEFAI